MNMMTKPDIAPPGDKHFVPDCSHTVCNGSEYFTGTSIAKDQHAKVMNVCTCLPMLSPSAEVSHVKYLVSRLTKPVVRPRSACSPPTVRRIAAPPKKAPPKMFNRLTPQPDTRISRHLQHGGASRQLGGTSGVPGACRLSVRTLLSAPTNLSYILTKPFSFNRPLAWLQDAHPPGHPERPLLHMALPLPNHRAGTLGGFPEDL